ncbi:lipid II flippase MurJ [Corynebacterium epidermidicanis]|uniref:Putative membrane protein, putative virulence factor n=1 Tax=Corynebacterium epidermidicanis TaxID=1050174 RepID=A0A0G3GT45_9CORY|nr:lipid II flippase MurJ [Corynebacterium epidermidicanis]AKK04351.1 putative membrane protein, putative virulence factor [Corynebacterium epidermidicanis]
MATVSEESPSLPGQRSRIREASPPAPAIPPKPKPASAEQGPATTATTDSDESVVRSTGSMAIATLISRITGFLRNAAIGATMGGAVASAFNTANTLPNLITEIVLGAVLTSLVVPVLIRAEKEDPDQGAAFIRRLFTLASSLLISVTVISVAAAPLLTRLQLSDEGKVNLSQSTAFAFLLLPQIFFYGIFSLFMAILNTKGIFKPGAWAPVVNNVIALATLALYWLIPGRLDPSAPGSLSDPHILLLGVGTTLGVVSQSLIMLPYLKRAGIDLRPLWGIDARLKQFGDMAMAIVVYVAISQAGYMITTRIASIADENAPNIYQQAWLLLQVPYGIIGVTLLTAIMPRLSRRAADGDDRGVVNDLTIATKLTFLALIPVIVFFMFFGPHIANALFAWGEFEPRLATILGWTLSFSAFTLIPYAIVLLHLRVFYAREEAWTPTFIIGGITATKVLLSYLAPLVATSPERVVVLLGTANGFGFVAGAVIGAFLLKRHLGSLCGPEIMRSVGWVLVAALPTAAVAWLCDAALSQLSFWGSIGSWGYLIRTAIAGILFLGLTAVALVRTPLEEVQSFVSLVRRKLGRTATQDAVAVQLAVAPTEIAPIPAPMSAGLVQPPRLVPGAPVLDGRFRLLVDCGSYDAESARARFWHAKDLLTGKDVALTFIDTTSENSASAAGVAAEITRRTRRLAERALSVVASNVTVVAYRSGCLVVSDWVRGSSVEAVAEKGEVAPVAATRAFAGLAAASAESVLGVESVERIRINANGTAMLAFPAVLPGMHDDGLVAAVKRLAPAATLSPVAEGEAKVSVVAEPAPAPAARAGFGAKRYSNVMTGVLIAISVAIVASIAALTTFLMGVFDGGQPDSPVRSVEKTIPAAPRP